MSYKVLIPSAGLGLRLGGISKNLNKALVPIDNKPSISHVIEKFDKDVEIVIALGHKGETLRDYIEIAHEDRNITFVYIENFSGAGSGLGLTILQCIDYLQCPFIFCPNDSIILDDIPSPEFNWMGYSDVQDSEQYRCIRFDHKKNISQIFEKEKESINKSAYIGLSAIKDYKNFWEFMIDGRNYGSIKTGESYAFKQMINNNVFIKAKKFIWYDTGSIKSLNIARKAISSDDSPHILTKPNEDIWFANKKVIKYNSDEKFISDRVERSKILRGYVPEITHHKKNMYSYKIVSGQTISKSNTQTNFSKLLEFLKKFWSKEPTISGDTEFKNTCRKFYKDKTLDRLNLYFSRKQKKDLNETVNGIEMPPIYNILDVIDWDYLCEGDPCRFHGDLHFENILLSETGEFTLLDWRQNFAGIKEYGDIYYDLAKIMHGLIVSHEIINKDLYNIEINDEIISFDLNRKHSLVENEKQFLLFLSDNDFDVNKVKILTALIYLNIAALHHTPYCDLLFYLGKSMLFKEVCDNEYIQK